MRKLESALLIVGLAIVAAATSVQAMDVGERLAPIQLTDQHDQTRAIDSDTRLILLASSHGAAKLVDQALKNVPPDFLAQREAVYVADISKVPGLVAKMVLVPSMRSASYGVLLDRKSALAPERVGAEPVLWITLEDSLVTSTKEFTDAKALRAALEQISP